MEFNDLSKRMAAAIEEAERVAPTGMFAQLLYHLSTALTRQKQWPLVAREAAFMAAEIGILNFFEWLQRIHPCQEPIRKAFRLANEFLASQHTSVDDYRFLVCKLLYELQGISTHSCAFTALTGFERIAQLSVRISFEFAREEAKTSREQPTR